MRVWREIYLAVCPLELLQGPRKSLDPGPLYLAHRFRSKLLGPGVFSRLVGDGEKAAGGAGPVEDLGYQHGVQTDRLIK